MATEHDAALRPDLSGMLGCIIGTHTLVVGVEDDVETGGLRMYLSHRARGLYAVIENEEAKDELRRAWAQSSRSHLTVEWPPEAALMLESERP